MIEYVVLSTFCLTVTWILYRIVLSHLHSFTFNRIYLLLCLIIAFGAPLLTFEITIPTQMVPVVSNHEILGNDLKGTGSGSSLSGEGGSAIPVLLMIYWIGVLVKLIRLTNSIRNIASRIKSSEIQSVGNSKLVLLNEPTPIYSFFHFIFVPADRWRNHKIPVQILEHEQAHQHQKHSLDILFIECLGLLFWYQPLLYFFKRAIRMNHEFLCDRSVLRKHRNVALYQQLLLAQIVKGRSFPLASPLNFSLTKKRFLMMKIESISSVNFWQKFTSIITLFAVALICSCTLTDPQKDAVTVPPVPGEWTNEVGMDVPAPPPAPKNDFLTTQLLNKWQDASEYAIWVDDKKIANQTLASMQPKDFATFRVLGHVDDPVSRVDLYSHAYYEKHLKSEFKGKE
ncbi:hypothetical protein CRP01_31990 [Flavilitoribacter nigricans DSM 23189 = NBRC 102662]|uniref:Peptidase M56 domain-containing protein n=2 Tax=Flavilitoribacter TaxID=2762562 RepID=A0A2D0N1N2_FLAN2|nr:hypothetical protein CRP01_31990 [Flavilitoribacter nigricans DSM 23189 = NBRC 102662]